MTAAYDDAVDVLVLAVHCTTNKVIIEKSWGEQYLFKKSFVFWHSAPTLNLGSTESTCIVLPNDSIFQYSVVAIFTVKNLCFMSTLLKETKSLKKWVKIVGNYHLVKYNMLIGYLVENSLLIITEKSSIIFSQTCRAISI